MDPGECAQIACQWEATARKAGNVHRQRDFADLRHADFLLSAAAIRPAMTQACQRPVGETILEAIRATRQVVSTNTNLGIVLLLAPLAAVPQSEPLDAGLQRVLNELTVDDARHVFAAIRLACPGGLGSVSQQDVRSEPTLPLREIMALAADRDLIARQYANGYREVLHGVEWLMDYRRDGYGIEETIVLTHVRFLADYPDSLIARKHGMERAREVSARAATVLDSWRAPRVSGGSVRSTPPADAGGSPEFAAFDSWLVAERLNPGTSADLVTACLFVALREGIITGDGWWVEGGGQGPTTLHPPPTTH